MIVAALALLLAIPPEPAAWIAAVLAGRPSIAATLVRICRRESNCTRIGLHAIDAGAGAQHWSIAVRGGALDPARCPLHRTPGPRWSTSGSWGMVRAYALRRLPWSCWLPPELLDVPLVGAIVAADLLLHGAHPATRRWAGS